jgi:hypothetical protein
MKESAGEIIMSKQSKRLFEEMELVGDYPKGVIPVPEQLTCTAFFPGGYGLWQEDGAGNHQNWPSGGIMVLGQDFHCEAGYQYLKNNPGANQNQPTWRNLKRRFNNTVCISQCFFTNLFMGLREGKLSTGTFPGANDREYVKRCLMFFHRQIKAQKPRLLITLGANVVRMLSTFHVIAEWEKAKTLHELDKDGLALKQTSLFGYSLTVVALTHPSCWVIRRQYKGWHGSEAEHHLLSDAVKQAGLVK